VHVGRLFPRPGEEFRAADYVQVRAELDLALVVSACPQDIVQINERNPTSVEIELQ
jgi:hypothetical protein